MLVSRNSGKSVSAILVVEHKTSGGQFGKLYGLVHASVSKTRAMAVPFSALLNG